MGATPKTFGEIEGRAEDRRGDWLRRAVARLRR
jgi:hypothetical protein